MTWGSSSARPESKYLETDLGYLGYQVFGEGDRDILFVSNALTNIDGLWDEPSAARFLDRLAGIGRVIVCDMRGTGISDPIPGGRQFMTIEGTVDDLKSVLDHVGSEAPIVYGDTEGGLFAIMFAATHPRRVSGLVLSNAFARLARADDYPIGIPKEVAAVLSDEYVAQHGTTGAMLELTAPSTAHDMRFRAWWTRHQRQSIPLGLVRTTFDWLASMDVRAALPQIQASTMVIARKDARFHRAAFGEYLAEHIPNSDLKVLDGEDTFPFFAGDFGSLLDVVEEFVGGHVETVSSDRILATVLFTDIVGSTALASEMGDEKWLDLLSAHNALARVQIERFRGKEVRLTGDGIVATFDGPARAISCAAAISDQLSHVGLTIRAGIHTGEIEYRENEIQGIAVHIASRIMNQAEGAGVMVSGTVRDLVVGSGIEFLPCGVVELKGVPGEWALFELVR